LVLTNVEPLIAADANQRLFGPQAALLVVRAIDLDQRSRFPRSDRAGDASL